MVDRNKLIGAGALAGAGALGFMYLTSSATALRRDDTIRMFPYSLSPRDDDFDPTGHNEDRYVYDHKTSLPFLTHMVFAGGNDEYYLPIKKAKLTYGNEEEISRTYQIQPNPFIYKGIDLPDEEDLDLPDDLIMFASAHTFFDLTPFYLPYAGDLTRFEEKYEHEFYIDASIVEEEYTHDLEDYKDIRGLNKLFADRHKLFADRHFRGKGTYYSSDIIYSSQNHTILTVIPMADEDVSLQRFADDFKGKVLMRIMVYQPTEGENDDGSVIYRDKEEIIWAVWDFPSSFLEEEIPITLPEEPIPSVVDLPEQPEELKIDAEVTFIPYKEEKTDEDLGEAETWEDLLDVYAFDKIELYKIEDIDFPEVTVDGSEITIYFNEGEKVDGEDIKTENILGMKPYSMYIYIKYIEQGSQTTEELDIEL